MLQCLKEEFWNHKMTGLENEKYTHRFQELHQLVPHMASTEAKRVERYIAGLIPEIRPMVAATRPPSMQEAITLVNILTYEQKRLGKPKDDGKRKADQASGSGRNNNKKGRRARGAKNFAVIATPEQKQYAGNRPRCN